MPSTAPRPVLDTTWGLLYDPAADRPYVPSSTITIDLDCS